MSDIEQEYSEEEQYEDESEEENKEESDEENEENEESDQFAEITPFIEQICISDTANRRTPNKLSRFEKTEAMSIRIFQIQNGDKIFVPIGDSKTTDAIAEKEIIQKKSPLIIDRYIGTKLTEDGKYTKIYEKYNLNEMKL